MIKNFLQELRTQRWDDHRYYHHSRINQSLHFVSAVSFLVAYVMLFIDPVVSALVGWLVSMTRARPVTSSSSRRGMTTSTRRPTSTRKRSRSATICSARSC